ncbi:TetR family transcriptional regulator [Brachybacterium vulturis]|uniref:TetR family transcriptional regulator n=1 Tax=Brachybacterium vulturis TaxID=2017484 RepID=UPI0037350ADC
MQSTGDEDVSSIDRIRESAIWLFGAHGFRATTLKSIAAEARVSQALIVHHFKSKAGLRTACDRHVAHLVRSRKEEVVDGPQGVDPFPAMRRLQEAPHLLRYLTRALTEGGESTAGLVDDMLEDAVEYLALGERSGLILPSATPRDRAALLLIWSLGALTLHEHVARLLGVDFLSGSTSPAELSRYLHPAIELYSQGLVAEHSLDGLLSMLPESPGAPPTHPDEER